MLPEARLDVLRAEWRELCADHGEEACKREWGIAVREIDDYKKFCEERDRRYLVAPAVYRDWDYWERGNLYLPDLPYTDAIRRLEFAGFRRYKILKKGGADGHSCFFRLIN